MQLGPLSRYTKVRHGRGFRQVRLRDRGERLFLNPRSYHVRIFAFGTVASNLFLLIMAMLFLHDSVRGHDQKSFLGLNNSSLRFFLSYDERGENMSLYQLCREYLICMQASSFTEILQSSGCKISVMS